MTQVMVRGYRFNPATVPEEVIRKVATKEMVEMRARIRRQEANRYAAENERARMVESSRNRMLAEKQRKLNIQKKAGVIRRTAKAVGTAWAMIWAFLIIVKDAIRDFGIKYGLWVYEPIDE